MKLLLDTHAWLWSQLEPSRISGAVARALDVPENEVWLSPVTAWETAALVRKGRIDLGQPWADWISQAWQLGGYREAALTVGVVGATNYIQLRHADPMDWLLAATARHYDLTLVTADRNLLAGAGFKSLAA